MVNCNQGKTHCLKGQVFVKNKQLLLIKSKGYWQQRAFLKLTELLFKFALRQVCDDRKELVDGDLCGKKDIRIDGADMMYM